MRLSRQGKRLGSLACEEIWHPPQSRHDVGQLEEAQSRRVPKISPLGRGCASLSFHANPRPAAQAMWLRKLPVVLGPQDDRAKPGDFVNVSADAGGLKALWGSGPGAAWRGMVPGYPIPRGAEPQIFVEEAAVLPGGP